MAEFPSFRPSSRTMKMGRFPTKTYRMMNGTRVKRSYGRRAFGYVLTLGFNNVPDTTTLAIWNHYIGQQDSEDFSVPAIVFSGIQNSTLLIQMRNPENVLWEYAEPPEINTVYTNVSVVNVVLVGELIYP